MSLDPNLPPGTILLGSTVWSYYQETNARLQNELNESNAMIGKLQAKLEQANTTIMQLRSGTHDRPLRIYTASGWPYRNEIAKINETLCQEHQVVSTWIERENGDHSPTSMGEDARRDVDEIGLADVVLALMLHPTYAYRGTWTEVGTALGSKKPVIIVCPGLNTPGYNCMTNVFFWHPAIQRVATLEEAAVLLRSVPKSGSGRHRSRDLQDSL